MMSRTLPVTKADPIKRQCAHCRRTVLQFQANGISVRLRHDQEWHETHIGLAEIVSLLALHGLSVINLPIEAQPSS